MFSLALLFLLTSADESEETIDCFCPPERGLPGTGCTERHFILCNSCHQGYTLEHVWVSMATWLCNPQPVVVTNEDFEEERHSAYSSEPVLNEAHGVGHSTGEPVDDALLITSTPMDPNELIVSEMEGEHLRDYQPCTKVLWVDMDALFAYEDIFGTDHDLGPEDFEIRSP